VAEIFMDSTYHIDFSSSFYNDLSYFFANVDPEGKVLPDSKNRDFGEKLIVNQLKIVRVMNQGTPTEREGSVQLTSSLMYLVL